MQHGDRKLIVLDRDGVINEDSADYVRTPEDWRPLPGSLAAIARLTAAGYDIAVATNQAGIGHGLYTERALEAIHERMRREALEAGGEIRGIYYCPHRPDDACRCRKPLPGLLQRIAEDFDRALAGVPLVGDKMSDMQAARAVGARPLFVRSGGRDTDARCAEELGIEIFADLGDVVDALLAE